MSVGSQADVNAATCPSRPVLEHVTSRWAVLLLAVLLDGGTLRFSELRRAVGGVSEKMLAQTLQTLERDGFVHREAHAEIPPRVDYSLTPVGREAAEQVWGLARWVERRLPEVTDAQQRYDRERAAPKRGGDGTPEPRPGDRPPARAAAGQGRRTAGAPASPSGPVRGR